MSDILVIGSSMYDLFTYSDRMAELGETLSANEFKTGFGGKGANQAVAAAKLGSNVTMLSALGDDDFGKQTYKNYQDNNVNTDFIRIIDNQSSGIATIIVDKTAQNRILIVKGANNYLTKEDVDNAFAKLNNIKIVVLQLEISLDIVYYAIQKAKDMGIMVLLNPAPAINDLNMDIVSLVDVLVPNESELNILTNMPVDSKDDIEAAALKLIKSGINNIIVTLGSKGALHINKEEKNYYAAPKVNAIDTTGAGDGFIGAFVHSYSKDNDFSQAIAFAIKYASTSTQKMGTQTSYPNKDDFLS